MLAEASATAAAAMSAYWRAAATSADGGVAL